MASTSRATGPTELKDSIQELAWLRSLSTPRAFYWLPLVNRRRATYVLFALLLIAVFEGWPEAMTLMHMGTGASWRDVHVEQVPLYMGMLVVVAFVGTCYALYKQFDDSKWLARRGEVAGANLLSVQEGDRQVLVTYRFWDDRGNEHEREATISQEGKQPLPPLNAGDVIPVLYDKGNPGRRNLLWPEIERYVTYRPKTGRTQSAPAPTS